MPKGDQRRDRASSSIGLSLAAESRAGRYVSHQDPRVAAVTRNRARLRLGGAPGPKSSPGRRRMRTAQGHLEDLPKMRTALLLCWKQSVGSDDCSDGSVCSDEALLFNHGGAHLDSEEGCKLRVGGDLALLRLRLRALV